MWTTPIDHYCERLDASFWAEPVNALSNAAFLIAAAAAYAQWRREARGDAAILALILVVAIVGLGSFAFHTLATPGARLLDVIPIGIFIYGYFFYALRRFLALSWPAALGLLAGFIAVSHALATLVPRAVLNGSVGYFPALAALVAIGLMVRQRPAGKAMLIAAGLFTVALAMRIVDLDVCDALPVGTHFLWHVFDAGVLYAVLRGAIEDRKPR